MEIINDLSPSRNMDYLYILKSLNEIKFSIGKNLLIDFLKGNLKNDSIKKNHLFMLNNFASLKKYSDDDIRSMIENLIANKMIDSNAIIGNSFIKILAITGKGQSELLNPSLDKKKVNFEFKNTIITEEEKILFQELGDFISKYNDEQKKAIISNKKEILCIAGAGSGKTSVLTKRIEFLVKYRSVNPEKILAITFTRKAREEMELRLSQLNIKNVFVETFNSFSEKILKKYGYLIYNKDVKLMGYSDKIFAMTQALDNLGMDMNLAVGKYFTEKEKNNKEQHQLSNIFMNDCFSILEYFKSKNQKIYDFSRDIKDSKDKETAKIIYQITDYLDRYMKSHGFRDYTDQILDAISLFKNNKSIIPKFEHILIDEYQDVNSMQIELIDILNKDNIFVVGDPRQSIFGWRGSDINYIMKFSEKYPESETINLIKNYRSSKKIVELMNSSIKSMNAPNLEFFRNEDSEIRIFDFDSEVMEHSFVIKKITELLETIDGEEIFVLARTNRQLNELSMKFKAMNIPHVLKTDEIRKPVISKKGDITLATIHAIKGLEAKVVFLIGCNEQNFPCKASDHPVIEIVKSGMQDYDREEEERRLFYVALSRAKDRLYLSYSGKKPSYFINNEMMNIIKES